MDRAFDLYLWAAPRDLAAEEATALIERWIADGANPAASQFEASTDVAWCFIELFKDMPGVEAVSDAVADPSRRPVWLSTGTPEPARLIALRLPRDDPGALREILGEVYGLATKYDLVVFEPHVPRIVMPNAEMAAYAAATFWPRGAIRAFVAGVIGLVLVAGAWAIGVPILSGIVIVVGSFLVLMTVITFAHDARSRLRKR